VIATLILAAVSIGSPVVETPTCAAREPQLEVISRPRSVPASYPIDDPTRKQAEGVVVLEIEVGDHGKPVNIAVVCDTAGARAVRAAKHAVREWQFSAPAHIIGQVELHFTAGEL
jgi:TonB family protein